MRVCEPWVVRTNSLGLFWDVKKILHDGMSLDHPRRKLWESSSNFVTSSVACSLSRTCLPLFTDYDRLWPLMNACCMLKVMKTMTQEPQSTKICQDRSAKPQISKYVSARILMKTLNTVGSFLKSKMKEKMREDSVATSHCVFFFRKQM